MLFVLLLAGCGSSQDIRTYVPYRESGPWEYQDPTYLERLVDRAKFSMEVLRFADERRTAMAEELDKSDYIYRYDPDRLLRGVSAHVPLLMQRYMGSKPREPKHYLVELALKKMLVDVKTGSFWSGSFGRYTADVEMTATVRRPDSSLVFLRHYRVYDEKPRLVRGGRGPSADEELQQEYEMVQQALRGIAAQIGSDIYYRDARKWKLPKNVSATVVPISMTIVRQGPVHD